MPPKHDVERKICRGASSKSPSGRESRANRLKILVILDIYYDRVHGGSTQLFIDPDKTEANFNRAESSSRREEARDHSTKLTRVGGRRGRTHIPRRVSNS